MASTPRPGSVRILRLAQPGLWATTHALNPTPDNSARPQAAANPPGAHAIAGWRRVVLWPLGLLLRLWGMSLRFEVAPEDIRHATKRDEPIAIVLWHNRLFLASEFYRRYRRGRQAYALISASQDGAWLDAFFDLVGMRAIRGSSSRFGREAATALVDVIRAGNDIGITPDGPRGPCYDLKPGALIVSRRTQAPMLLLGWEFASAWRLKSWDRFYVPKPFSRVRMRCEIVTHAELAGDRELAAERLRARLLAINPDQNIGATETLRPGATT